MDSPFSQRSSVRRAEIVPLAAQLTGLPKAGAAAFQDFMLMGTETVRDFGGMAIVDVVDISKRRCTFMIDRTVNDIGTAEFTDPRYGTFTQPILMNLRYKVTGEYGQVPGRGVRLLLTRLENNSDSPGTSANWTVLNGGTIGKSSWGHVVEGFDTSARPGYVQGDCDFVADADLYGAPNNVFVGMEINHKLKLNSVFVGLQILTNTYGRLVQDNGGVRPKAQRCIAIGPGNDGGGAVGGGGNPTNWKTGADILRAIDIFGAPANWDGVDPTVAHTDYGIWGRVPMKKAFIAMAQTDKIVFDNDNGERVVIRSPGLRQWEVAIDDVSMFRVDNARAYLRGSLRLDTPTPSNREISFRTNGVQRWAFRCNNAAETGSGAGSDLQLYASNDEGTESQVIRVVRATGQVQFKATAHFDNVPTIGAGNVPVAYGTGNTGSSTTPVGTVALNIGGTVYYLLRAAAA